MGTVNKYFISAFNNFSLFAINSGLFWAFFDF